MTKLDLLNIPEAYAARNSDGPNNVDLMSAADLEGLDNIGQVSDIILSNDGRVQALVVSVGGFLGRGEQDVALTMDQVSYAANSDDQQRIYVVVTTPSDALSDAPAFFRDRAERRDSPQCAAAGGISDRETVAGTHLGLDNPATGTGPTAFVAAKMARDGYDQIGVSAEQLVGMAVFGTDEGSVGTITELILDENGGISNVFINFGGFLDVGSSQMSVSFDEWAVLSNQGQSDLRSILTRHANRFRRSPTIARTTKGFVGTQLTQKALRPRRRSICRVAPQIKYRHTTSI